MNKVTMFSSGVDTKNPKYFTVEKIVDWIRKGQWKTQVEKLNSFQYDSKQQKDYKTHNLPAIVWQGTFKQRNDKGVIDHSGLICLDFDKLDGEAFEHHRDTLIADKHTCIMFASPRMNGLKVVVKIPASTKDHKAYARGLKQYYKSSHYDHFEDLSRLCFVSYDPEIYFNPDAEVWNKRAEIKQRQQPTTAAPDDVVAVFRKLVLWAEKNHGYTDGNKHKHLIALYSACNRFGVPLVNAIDLTYQHYSKIGGVEAVPRKDFQSRCESVYNLYSDEHATQRFDNEPHKIKPPEIETISNEPPPVFPIQVFPKSVQGFINVLNESLNYSVDFLSIANMFTIATLNGNTYKLRVKNGWISPSVFWFAVVGDPGTMKSHPISTTIHPIGLIDKESKRNYDYDLGQWESNEKKGNRPQFRQILISDYTLEALHHVHSHNKRGIGMYKDELVGFMNDMNKYRKGSDEQFWLESFNNKSYIVNRVSKEPLQIDDTMINIIGTIQPAILSKVVKDHAGNGLIDRFLFTASETRIIPLTKCDVDKDWFDWWTESIKTIHPSFSYTGSEDTIIVDMLPDALDRVIEIDKQFCSVQMSGDVSPGIKNYISKMKTYLPRFALLMFIYDRLFNGTGDYVSLDHIERANLVIEYFINSARHIFGDADKIEEMSNVIGRMNGMTKVEKIIQLHAKGYKNADIARQVGSAPSYVSKIIKEKTVN